MHLHKIAAVQPPLGSAETAERLNIDRSTLTRWVASGRIAPIKRLSERGPLLFDPAAVEALAAELADEHEARAAALREATA